MKGTLPNPDWHVVFMDGEVWYYCNEPIVFNSHKGDDIIIPAKFLHNGGSIPWMFTSGLKKDGLMLSYYALHDFLYRKDCPYDVTRNQSDRLLRQYGKLAGYPWIKRQAVYAGVVSGGWISWRKQNAKFHQ